MTDVTQKNKMEWKGNIEEYKRGMHPCPVLVRKRVPNFAGLTVPKTTKKKNEERRCKR